MSNQTGKTSEPAKSRDDESGIWAPLSESIFRRIWSASLVSNLGQQMQVVAASWAMLEVTRQADLVAMVQTASMLPVMLLAIAAGAIADMYDKRKVALFALMLALSGAILLAMASAMGIIAPALILICVFITGTGISLYSPAWQASASEIVGVRALPAAVALYSLSNNAARSVGPAIGGFLIATAGIITAFSLNAVLYLPILIALFLWKREVPAPRLPPERIDRAMLAGLRFVHFSPPTRRVIFRSLFTAFGGAAIYSMLPLVADRILDGGPRTYGLLLGCFGLGAVSFALITSKLRNRFSPEAIVASCSAALSIIIAIAAYSPFVLVTGLAMIIAGGSWMVSISTCNIAVQLSSPRWVSGRTLAAFQAAVAGGLAIGSLVWGVIAEAHGVVTAMTIASIFMGFTLMLGRLLRVPTPVAAEAAPPPSNDPLVQMALSGRSGPMVIEIEYRVRSQDARPFYHAMRDVRRSRERNGAFSTSLARDISDPELWVERFHYPTWNDYLRARDRPTIDDREWRNKAVSYHFGAKPPKVRRYLERPTGSVRWREDTVDPGETLATPATLNTVGSS